MLLGYTKSDQKNKIKNTIPAGYFYRDALAELLLQHPRLQNISCKLPTKERLIAYVSQVQHLHHLLTDRESKDLANKDLESVKHQIINTVNAFYTEAERTGFITADLRCPALENDAQRAYRRARKAEFMARYRHNDELAEYHRNRALAIKKAYVSETKSLYLAIKTKYKKIAYSFVRHCCYLGYRTVLEIMRLYQDVKDRMKRFKKKYIKAVYFINDLFVKWRKKRQAERKERKTTVIKSEIPKKSAPFSTPTSHSPPAMEAFTYIQRFIETLIGENRQTASFTFMSVKAAIDRGILVLRVPRTRLYSVKHVFGDDLRQFIQRQGLTDIEIEILS